MISERDIIYITKKQASLSVAILAVFCLLVFMLGYFWGKQSVLEGFGQRVTQESLQDQVDCLLTMQSFAQKVKPEMISEIQQESNITEQDNEQKVEQVTQVQKNDVVHKVSESSKPSVKKVSSKKHRAILLGFGTKSAAIAFVNRLKKHNILVEIKPRTSKSASGKTQRTWYQVVTKSYDSKDDVQKEINNIKKFERIKDGDIKII